MAAVKAMYTKSKELDHPIAFNTVTYYINFNSFEINHAEDFFTTLISSYHLSMKVLYRQVALAKPAIASICSQPHEYSLAFRGWLHFDLCEELRRLDEYF